MGLDGRTGPLPHRFARIVHNHGCRGAAVERRVKPRGRSVLSLRRRWRPAIRRRCRPGAGVGPRGRLAAWARRRGRARAHQRARFEPRQHDDPAGFEGSRYPRQAGLIRAAARCSPRQESRSRRSAAGCRCCSLARVRAGVLLCQTEGAVRRAPGSVRLVLVHSSGSSRFAGGDACSSTMSGSAGVGQGSVRVSGRRALWAVLATVPSVSYGSDRG